MTREQYLNIKRKKQINQNDLQLFYVYYCNTLKNKNPYNFGFFSKAFPFYFNFVSKDIINFLDKRFNISILEDKNGNEIKVW